MKIGAAHKQDFTKTADRFIGMLKQLEGTSLGFACDQLQHASLGFACDQLQHALMCGTLARRDGATEEQIVVALCHDMAKVVNVPNHGPIVAEMLRPYIGDDSYHVLRNHQPWYDYAVKLVDEWDAPAFDPDFEVDSLESFEPLIRKIVHDSPMAVG